MNNVGYQEAKRRIDYDTNLSASKKFKNAHNDGDSGSPYSFLDGRGRKKEKTFVVTDMTLKKFSEQYGNGLLLLPSFQRTLAKSEVDMNDIRAEVLCGRSLGTLTTYSPSSSYMRNGECRRYIMDAGHRIRAACGWICNNQPFSYVCKTQDRNIIISVVHVWFNSIGRRKRAYTAEELDHEEDGCKPLREKIALHIHRNPTCPIEGCTEVHDAEAYPGEDIRFEEEVCGDTLKSKMLALCPQHLREHDETYSNCFLGEILNKGELKRCELDHTGQHVFISKKLDWRGKDGDRREGIEYEEVWRIACEEERRAAFQSRMVETYYPDMSHPEAIERYMTMNRPSTKLNLSENLKALFHKNMGELAGMASRLDGRVLIRNVHEEDPPLSIDDFFCFIKCGGNADTDWDESTSRCLKYKVISILYLLWRKRKFEVGSRLLPKRKAVYEAMVELSESTRRTTRAELDAFWDSIRDVFGILIPTLVNNSKLAENKLIAYYWLVVHLDAGDILKQMIQDDMTFRDTNGARYKRPYWEVFPKDHPLGPNQHIHFDTTTDITVMAEFFLGDGQRAWSKILFPSNINAGDCVDDANDANASDDDA